MNYKNKIFFGLCFIATTLLYSCSAMKNYTVPKDELVIRKKDEMNKETQPTKILSSDKKEEIKKTSNSNYQRPTNLSNREYEKYLVEHYSTIMNTPPTYVRNNLDLYKFIDLWYGTPYRYGGSSQNGIDCSAFAKTLYSDVYHVEITREGNAQFNECDVIEKDDLQEGDLLFFKIGSWHISHVAVYIGNGKFVHAASSKGVMISDLSEAYYKRYFFKAGRPKNK
ncbi:MAG: hypothetical protein RJA07_526 [Bacteroidota bacterium]|jgi:lipoprotein Spr